MKKYIMLIRWYFIHSDTVMEYQEKAIPMPEFHQIGTMMRFAEKQIPNGACIDYMKIVKLEEGEK